MNEREAFYSKTVREFIPDKDAAILVVGGGIVDRDVLHDAGFTNVLISNLDTRIKGDEFAPYDWKYENAAALSFEDNSFDFTLVHASIHHAAEPHRVLTEMYRVARRGLLAFEARDSWTMRMLERFGLTQTYEHAAVYYNDCEFGGVDNTDIPNFVYRWTEREVEKTIRSFEPHFVHKFQYRYGTAFPCTPELENKASAKTVLLKIARPFFSVFATVAPGQQNLFAFFVEKPSGAKMLHPWLEIDGDGQTPRFNRSWGDERYKSNELMPPDH